MQKGREIYGSLAYLFRLAANIWVVLPLFGMDTSYHMAISVKDVIVAT